MTNSLLVIRDIDLLIVLLSHALASLPFWMALRRGKVPKVSDFAVISVILYYDVGLVWEALGYPYTSVFFSPLFQADDTRFLYGMVLLALAPWMFHLGAYLTNPRRETEAQVPSSRVAPGREILFYLLVLLLALPVALYGLSQV